MKSFKNKNDLDGIVKILKGNLSRTILFEKIDKYIQPFSLSVSGTIVYTFNFNHPPEITE